MNYESKGFIADVEVNKRAPEPHTKGSSFSIDIEWTPRFCWFLLPSVEINTSIQEIAINFLCLGIYIPFPQRKFRWPKDPTAIIFLSLLLAGMGCKRFTVEQEKRRVSSDGYEVAPVEPCTYGWDRNWRRNYIVWSNYLTDNASEAQRIQVLERAQFIADSLNKIDK